MSGTRLDPGMRVRERAYLLWERAGRPEGRADEFWERAQRHEARAAEEERVDEEARKGFPASDPPSHTGSPARVGAALEAEAERIPSLGIAGAGCPAALEVGDDDLTMLTARARPPRRFVGPWRRRGVGLPLLPSTSEGT